MQPSKQQKVQKQLSLKQFAPRSGPLILPGVGIPTQCREHWVLQSVGSQGFVTACGTRHTFCPLVLVPTFIWTEKETNKIKLCENKILNYDKSTLGY